MNSFLEEYLDRLEALNRYIQAAIDELPVSALDWVPGPDIPSIGAHVTHIAGSLRFWIGDVALGESFGRDREAEFHVQSQDVDTLKERLKQVMFYIRVAVEKLALKDLEETCANPQDSKRYTIAWALLHALEHAGLHTGHIQIIRQLWEQRQSHS